MAIFAVQYTYSGDADEMGAIRPAHREFSRVLFEDGVLLASGPIVGRNGALLIFRSDSLESLASLLNTDPFEQAGLIGERVIEEWNSVFSPWENK
ncbi:MAG: hypothetical protein RJA35_1345 [Actinomycetota bacterium]|jgi:uncharacterized protein YciI